MSWSVPCYRRTSSQGRKLACFYEDNGWIWYIESGNKFLQPLFKRKVSQLDIKEHVYPLILVTKMLTKQREWVPGTKRISLWGKKAIWIWYYNAYFTYSLWGSQAYHTCDVYSWIASEKRKKMFFKYLVLTLGSSSVCVCRN